MRIIITIIINNMGDLTSNTKDKERENEERGERRNLDFEIRWYEEQ